MKAGFFEKYALNCFLLLIPVMVWDIVLTDRLPMAFQPEFFWKNIPAFLSYGENISRTVIFALALVMPLRIVRTKQKAGLLLYAAGLTVYFACWLALIYFPDSSWSRSLPGFTAPAFTPFLWLAAIGMIGDSFYFKLPYKPWYYLLVALVFLLFHNIHAGIIYFRIYG